jgi:heme-degrading monooxygenase HmoA
VQHHLAQVNVAYSRGAQDDPVMAEFIAQLDEINTLADRSPGFVWRYISDTRDEAQREFEDGKVLFNLTVWESMEALHAFTYRTNHAKVFAARKKWFEDWKDSVRNVKELGEGVPFLVLWWVPAGHIPSAKEGIEKLRLLGQKGPCPEAFTFKQAFSPAGQPLER